MALPELIANSPTPGSRSPLATLATPLADAVTTLTTSAAAPAALQGAGQFRIVVEAEIMLVTAGAGGTSWTVTRAVESSVATSHGLGAKIWHFPTAGALDARYARVGTDGTIGGPGGTALPPSVETDIAAGGAKPFDSTGIGNGQVLAYDSASGHFKPVGATGILTGSPTGGIPAWAALTPYGLNQEVVVAGITYVCKVAHTSGATFSGVGTNWQALGVSAAFTPNSGVTYTFKLTSVATSAGSVGWTLDRSADSNESLAIHWSQAGTLLWAYGLDTATTDLVLAYDFAIPGDVFRLRQKVAGVNDGANLVLGPGIGQPSASYRLDIQSPASDAHVTALLRFSVFAGSSIETNDLVNATGAAGVLWEVKGTGKAGFGRGYGATFADGAIEAQGYVYSTLVNKDNYFVIERTGTSSQTWLMGIESASSNQWVLKDNATSHRAIIIRGGASLDDASLFMDGAHGITLGVAASKLGFYGHAVTVQQLLATGAGHTVDDVITALQTLGLVKQA